MSTSDPFLPLDPSDLPHGRSEDDLDPQDPALEPERLGEPQPGAASEERTDDETEEEVAEREHRDGGAFHHPQPGDRLTAAQLQDDLDAE